MSAEGTPPKSGEPTKQVSSPPNNIISLDGSRAKRFLSRLAGTPFIALLFNADDSVSVYHSADVVLDSDALRNIRMSLDRIEEQMYADSNEEEGRQQS
jgi:hypothetical protein